MTLDEPLVKAIQDDYRTAPLSDQDRTMLEYVEKITRDATQVSREDHDRLRAVGFDDKGILQITLIASCSTTSTGWRTLWEWEESDGLTDKGPALKTGWQRSDKGLK